MIRFLFYSLVVGSFLSSFRAVSQVGIGTIMPDKSTILEIVSTNKGILIPRVSLTGVMDETTIINGNKESLLVYNITKVADVIPGYYYWATGKWNKIATTNENIQVNADNGLMLNNNSIILGGDLKVPTSISASSNNTLAIKGLENGDTISDDVVVVDKITGILKKVNMTPFLKEKQAIVIAVDNQTEFTPPLPIFDIEKINVYRNGIRVNFTLVNSSTIKLEADATCFQNDEIRIIQFY
ncbi:hypothetical protein ACHRVZ_15665 [Flavobacterium sp. FlaQc-57]|uniref:hypothetical protein n=1 Tax=Flavobacterium sp. FlaQc-57 TaxID=3374186 RepID=UPI003757B1FE